MKILTVIVTLSLLCAGRTALARETFHDLSVGDATESALGQERLLDVPYYMVGQQHPKVKQDMGVFTSNKRTNAFNKSDARACQIAFLSALISLQSRAQREGAEAVVDIKSITRHNDLESPSEFRCVAGNIIANVALTGRIVRFAK